MNRDEIVRLFEGLNLRGNQVVVHASLSSFGHVEGGQRGEGPVCLALRSGAERGPGGGAPDPEDSQRSRRKQRPSERCRQGLPGIIRGAPNQ